MEITVRVQSPNGEYVFSCLVHCTLDEYSRKIERDFYQQWCSTIPRGVHHELEILEIPDMSAATAAVHVHLNPETGKKFVCWTGRLPTEDSARALFRKWCAGMTYTLVHDEDFVDLFHQHPNDFLECMGIIFDIRVSEV